MKFSRVFVLTILTLGIFFTLGRPVSARDEWIQVKSKNFYLIGNASEKDIRKVGTRLEEFRETFRQVFRRMNLTSPITTNVIVFKSNSSYKNFKPKRADGTIDENVAGYFQPGDDVNYITLSTEGEDADTFSVIFHEYVHFIVDTNFGKSEVPAWFNEGLAEYYSTFAIEDDQKVKLGLPIERHLMNLTQNQLMPLDRLLKLSNYQLRQMGNHSTGIFYSESWALIHYMLQGGKSAALGKFIELLALKVPADKAFQDAFQISYADMETELRKYVGKNRYQYNLITFSKKLTFDAELEVSPLSEAVSNTYLGDLLYHTHRPDDAEPFLLNALKLQPDLSSASTALGMVRIEQRKYDEAKTLLEKAIAGDQRNHIAFYRYAFLLSREGRDEFGYVRTFDKAAAAKMREALRKAIAINPAFTESYELLAFVDIVNLEELDDAAQVIQTALKYQPGNQRYALRLAEILSRQSKLDEARSIAEKISLTSDDSEVKGRAEGLLNFIEKKKSIDEFNAAERKRYEAALAASGGKPPKRIEGGKPLTEEEKVRGQEEANLRSINESLRKPADGEQRVIGHVQTIDCRARPIVFTVKTGDETFTVTSRDFDALVLNTFEEAANNVAIGCQANISAFNALLTYRTGAAPRSTSRGELKAIEFVADNFRLMTEEELNGSTLVIYEETDPASASAPGPVATPNSPPDRPSPTEMEERRRASMMKWVKDSLRKPADGERREMGFLDKIECSKKDTFYHLRTATRTLRLRNVTQSALKIVTFLPDLNGMEFGCTLRPIEFPVVFTYVDKPDAKAKTAGEIVALEFVPRSFVLDQ